jgi:hypothetical protein
VPLARCIGTATAGLRVGRRRLMGQASLTCEQVEFLLEVNDPDQWVDLGGRWDTSLWDDVDGTPAAKAIWNNEVGVGWLDATQFNRGFVLERGRQTSWDEVEASTLEFELDNSTGEFSVYGSQAHPRIRPGADVQVNAIWDGVRYPIFNGFLSEWVEGQSPDDFTIRGKAVDGLRKLADPVDIEYHAGVDKELAGSRINRLLNRAKVLRADGSQQPRQIQTGDSTMTNYLTSRTILEEIKITAESDAGLFFVDNDGTYMYLNRSRYFGRPQESMLIFGDGCNSGELPYAAIEPILADAEFGNMIMATNVSQGNDSPKTAKAINKASIALNGRYIWSPAQLIICNANHVQGYVDWQLMRRSTAFYRINSFECYPIHRDDLWPALLRLRIGDIIKVLRRPPLSDTIEANMLVDGMRIEATPEMWKFVVRCSPGTITTELWYWSYNANWDEATWL